MIETHIGQPSSLGVTLFTAIPLLAAMYIALLMAIYAERSSLSCSNYAAMTTNAIDFSMKASQGKLRITIVVEFYALP